MDSDFWYHKGVVLNQMGENEFALNCYEQALKLNQNHKASIFNLACAYEKLKKYGEALNWFHHAINVDNEWPDAHYGLALCSLKLGRNEEALKHIEEAVTWSIAEFKVKMRKRRIKARERRRAIEDAMAKGELISEKDQRKLKQDSDDDDEDYTSADELYIDPATKKNNGVSTHVMYVRALCNREVKDY